MDKVSIIVPSRKEQYLQNTVSSLLDRAGEDVEVIIVLDGYWPDPPLGEDDRIKIVHFPEARGMRHAINSGAAVATGKYLMKCDAHCCFDKHYDIKLKADCEPDWVVVPRRYALDKKKWARRKKIYYDFQYISHPRDSQYPFKGVDWPEYGRGQKCREKK